LLLTGFAGAFRRPELAAIRVEDVEETKEGLQAEIPGAFKPPRPHLSFNEMNDDR
jgi:hypothetical protein